MPNLVLIFVTGLTAGGLSCLAIQGGLLAGAVAPERTQTPVRPILLFLAAKLAAYTALGAALGWFGQMLQLTPFTRATLQIAIGLFMLVTALRLLNVHPVFRHFAIAPPKFVTRYIRRRGQQEDNSWLAPTFLGALTVLIPCGVTQAMMALAVASGNPVAGALVLFAFVLGTTPIFFALAYLATKLGEKWEAKFWKATGAVVLILGLIAIDGGLTLAGSPVSSAAIRRALAPRQTADLPVVAASIGNELTMDITDERYAPALMEAKAGLPIRLTVRTHAVRGCGRSLVIPSMNLQKLLAPDDQQIILIPPQVAGTIRLTCIMGMYGAQITVK